MGWGEIVIQEEVESPLSNGSVLEMSAGLVDAEGDDVEESEQTVVSSAPELSLGNSDGRSTVYAGDLVTYTLTASNSGNENAVGVIITDTLSSYVEYRGCAVAGGNCQQMPTGEVVFEMPEVEVGGSKEATLLSHNRALFARKIYCANRSFLTIINFLLHTIYRFKFTQNFIGRFNRR